MADRLRLSFTKDKWLLLFFFLLISAGGYAQQKMEFLDRGLVAIKTSPSTIFLSWRLLGTDDVTLPFNLYRQYDNGNIDQVNIAALTEGTNFVDTAVDVQRNITYILKQTLEGKDQECARLTLVGSQEILPYLSIPLRTPPGYTPGDISVGDLDGDGTYEIIVHQTGKIHDNAHNGITDPAIFQAYKLDGTFMWEINLGKNVRDGAHYTPLWYMI